MQGPLWAQIAVFFLVAIPATLLLTHVLAWFGRFLTPVKKGNADPGLFSSRAAFVEDTLYTPLDDVLARCAGTVRLAMETVSRFLVGKPYRLKNTGEIVVFSGDKDGSWGIFQDLQGRRSFHAYSDLTYALPRHGECWSSEECARHRHVILQIWLVSDTSEWFLDEKREEEIRCGCLKPVSAPSTRKE